MIEDHKHCVICGRPMEPNKTICSPSCEELMKQQHKKMARQRKMMLIFFIGFIALITIVSILTPRT